MKELSLGVYIASYNRADTCTTHKLLEYGTYVVRKSEEEAYRANGITDIIGVEDELINSVVKVNDWIIHNTPEDIVCILDDDICHFYYRMWETVEITGDKELVSAEIERFAQLMADLDIGYGATDTTIIPYNYTQEFEFKGMSGAIRWVNKKAFKAKPNDELRFNWDLDVVLQELLLNRVILKPKYFCSKGKTDTNKGGLSDKKRGDQIACIERMKAKWGKYFQYDLKKNKPTIQVKR